MPTKSFSSFEAFFDANQHACLRAMVLGPDRGKWVLTNLPLSGITVQFGEAGGNAVVEGSSQPDGTSIFILLQGLSAMSGNGRRFDGRTLLIARQGDEFCLAADAWRRWCSFYIPDEVLARANEDAPTTAGSKRGVFRLPLQRIERFRSVIQRLDAVAHQAPDAFQSVAAQKAAQQKLVPEICNMLAVAPKAQHSVGRHVMPREQIIRLAMDCVDRHSGEHVSVGQLVTAAGVSERTLRDAFQQYFGASPVRYLSRRTLHQVRRALKATDPSVATVTEIAIRFGVWELGRFARDYRSLFGELPSVTLRH